MSSIFARPQLFERCRRRCSGEGSGRQVAHPTNHWPISRASLPASAKAEVGTLTQTLPRKSPGSCQGHFLYNERGGHPLRSALDQVPRL